jgi:hypothetical protein
MEGDLKVQFGPLLWQVKWGTLNDSSTTSYGIEKEQFPERKDMGNTDITSSRE